MADIGGTVSRGVIRNDQLEILVSLAKQSLQRLGEVVSRRCRPEARCSAGAARSCSAYFDAAACRNGNENGCGTTTVLTGEDPHR